MFSWSSQMPNFTSQTKLSKLSPRYVWLNWVHPTEFTSINTIWIRLADLNSNKVQGLTQWSSFTHLDQLTLQFRASNVMCGIWPGPNGWPWHCFSKTCSFFSDHGGFHNWLNLLPYLKPFVIYKFNVSLAMSRIAGDSQKAQEIYATLCILHFF